MVLVAAIALITGGCLRMTVTKNVVGGSWEHPVTVHVSCSTAAGQVDQDFVFDAGNIAQPQAARPIPISETGTTCTWTEPQSGGAQTVTIACENPPAGTTCTSAPGSLSITVPRSDSFQFVNIIVTNCTATFNLTKLASLNTKRRAGFPAPLPCGCIVVASVRSGTVPCGPPI